MEFEGRGRQAGPEGFGMPARFLADSPAPGRLEVELRDPSRALALLGELGSKVTEESLAMMPVLLSLLKHDAAIVVRQSIVNGTRFFCSVLEEIAIQMCEEYFRKGVKVPRRDAHHFKGFAIRISGLALGVLYTEAPNIYLDLVECLSSIWIPSIAHHYFQHIVGAREVVFQSWVDDADMGSLDLSVGFRSIVCPALPIHGHLIILFLLDVPLEVGSGICSMTLKQEMIYQIGKIGRWLEDMWAWMVKFKDAVCGLAAESGSVPVRALAVKFLEVYILLFTSDGNDHEGSFMEDKARSFNISQLIGVHSIFEPALLSSEMSKCLGLLLDLLQSSSMPPGSLTIVIISCLSAIARKRPVHYSRILYALLAFNPDSQTRDGAHVSSIRYSLKTAFIGFLKCIHHPLITESREKLVRALRTLHPGDTTEQIIRQIDKMTRNAENVSRDARFFKDDKTSSQLPASGDTISKRSIMHVINDGSSIPDDMLRKRSCHAVSVSLTASAPSTNDFAEDDDNEDIDAANGFSPNVSLLDSDMTTVEKMIVMIGALLAQGERGAESLEILISQMQPDLLADIVILNMKHLPKSPLPLFTRLGSYASQIPSSDSSLQTGTPMTVVTATETSDMSSQVFSSSPSVSVLSTSITDVPSFPNHLADTKRDPRRDPRRLDPRRVTSTVAQPMTLNLENGSDVQSVLDDSLGRPVSTSTIATKVHSSSVPSTFTNEAVISESSQSVEISTLQESPALLDEPLEKGPILAVEATSNVPLSPVHGDQDLEPLTPSETTGDDGADIPMAESDPHSSSVTSASSAEEESHELPSLPLFIDLTDDKKKRMSRLAVSRIAESYKQVRATGSAHAHLCLLALLVSQADADVDMVEMLQKYVAKDYHHQKGHELAMCVLYQLHSVMVSGAEEECYSSASCTYEQFFLALAKSLCNILPASDKSFSRLLNEAPLLPESALNLLDDLCHSPGYKQHGKDAREGDRVTQGLGAVWSLILVRPCTRQACLKIALRCAVDSQDEVRGKAIRLVANKLYPLSYVTENIEQFAKTMILSLMDEQVPDKEVALGTSDDQRSEAECQEASTSDSQLDPSPVERLNTKVAQSGLQSASAVSFTKAQQHSSLFFALCTKKPNLLQFVFDIYGRAPKAVKQSINWHAPDLVRKLGSSCPELLNIISNFPEGSENLLMLVLQIMTEEMPPSAELIATVKKMHQTKYKDAAIVIPILSSLSKEEVLPIFPRLVDLPMEKFQTALARILQGSAHTGPALTPTEVLVAIHDINPERDGVALKKIMEVCTTCFEQKTVFTQHVFVRALNELIERTTVPLLFMRTVIQAVDAFPSLIDFVMEILSKLVTKQVWRMPKLWPGFLKCASQTKPHSFPVLLQLPPTILENVLQKHAILKAPLATYANQAHIRSSLPRQVLEVLGSGNEQKQPSR